MSQHQRWPHQVGGEDELQRPVPGIDDPERFHQVWEARVFGLGQTIDLFPTDEFRHAIERLEQYARLTYFEKWLAAIEHLTVAHGYISQQELELVQRRRLEEHEHAHVHEAPTIAPHAEEHLAVPHDAERFAPGDVVILAEGLGEHHRLPDWARGRRANVRTVRGRFPLPDLVVAGIAPDVPYALYSVELTASDAFGDADPRDRLHLDVYDPYLQPAEAAG